MTRTLLSLAIGEKEMKAVGEQKISQLKTSELTEVSLQSARPMDNSLVDNSVKTNEKANSLEEPDENVPSYHHIKGVTGRKYSVGAILPINDQHPPKLPLRVTNSLGAESLLATMTLPSNPDGQGADTAAVEIPKKDRELQTSLHPSTLTKMPSTESRINDNMKSSSEVPIERLPAAQRASEFHKKYTEFQRVMRPLSVSIHSHFAENLEVSNMIFSKPSSLPKETKTTETVAPIRSGAKPFRPDLLQPNQNKMDIQPTIKSPSIVAPTGTPLTPPPTPVDGGKPTFFSHNNDHGADLAKGLEMLKNKTEKSEAINDVTSNGPVSNVQSSSKITQLSAFLERQDRWRFPLDKFKSLPSMATSERHRVIPPNEQIIEASRNVHKEKNDLINDSSVFAVPARVEEVTSDHNSLNRHTGFYTVRLKKVPPTLVDLLRNPHKIKEKESPTSPFSSSSSNQGLETNSLTDGYIQSDTFLQHDTAKVTVQQKEEKERPINYRQTVTRSLVIEPYRKPDISVFGSAQNVSETLSSTLNSAPDGSGSSASVNRQTDVIQSQVAFESYLQPNMIEATDTRQGFPPVTSELMI